MTERIKVRDGRLTEYFMVGNEVVDAECLDPYTGWLYTVLCRYTSIQDDTCFPSLNTLCARTNMSKPKLISCIEKLESLGMLTVRRVKDENQQNEVNLYTVYGYDRGVVNEVNHPSKPQLLGVVNDVYPNNTHLEDTQEKTSTPAMQDVQDTPKPAKYRLLTKAAKDELLPVLFEYGLGKPMASYTPAEITQLMKNRLTAVLKALQPLDDESLITATELEAAYKWFKKQYRDASYPIGANTLPTLLSNYRASNRVTENNTLPAAPVVKPRPDITPRVGTRRLDALQPLMPRKES